MYWRLEFTGAHGEHKAMFCESDGTGMVLQQFVLTLDASIGDLEHCRLSTLAGIDGKLIRQIDQTLPWRRVTADVYEAAVELKRIVFQRDERLRAATEQSRCGTCGGTGKLFHGGGTCPACQGVGHRTVVSSRVVLVPG